MVAAHPRRAEGSPPRSPRRLLVGAGILGLAVGLTAQSARGSFSSAQPVTLATTTGVVALTVADGDAGQVFVDSLMPGLFPGEVRQRRVDLTIGGTPQTGTVDLDALSLVVAVAAVDVPLVNDPANGLQLTIERCSAAWQESGGHPTTDDATYTCPAATTTVVDRGPVLGSFDLTADPGDSLVALGDVNHYRFTFELPDTATAAMQNTGSIVRFTFDGTARAGTDA